MSFLRPYIMDWGNEESDSLHLEYSYDQVHWYKLNGGHGVLFADHGHGRMKDPFFVKGEDGSFTLYAADAVDDAFVYTAETKDFISYGEVSRVPASQMGVCRPEDVVIGITDEQLSALQEVFGKPEPVVVKSVETPEVTVCAGEKISLPERVCVNWSNGSTEQLPVTWENVDSVPAEAGSYEVDGFITEHLYQTPLIYHRADPFIYRHTDGCYYFTASHTDDEHNLDGKYQYRYIIIRRAKTLDDLADEGGNYIERTVYSREPLPGGESPHIWAPEIHYIDGKFYIYFTTVIDENDLWSIRPHCLMCEGDPMTDEWVNKGPIAKTTQDNIAFTDFSLDHTVLQHNGELYLFWAEKHPVISDIYAARMVNPWTIDSSRIAKIVSPDYNWEQHGFQVCEGPGFLHRNGRLFMTYSASGTDAFYCLGLLTIDENADLLEPSNWKKSPCPVFISCPENGQFGPGHNSFTTDEEGHDIFVFHSRQEERYLIDESYQPLYDAGRNACLTRLHWNPDGTPNFSVPAPVGPKQDVKIPVKAVVTVK